MNTFHVNNLHQYADDFDVDCIFLMQCYNRVSTPLNPWCRPADEESKIIVY